VVKCRFVRYVFGRVGSPVSAVCCELSVLMTHMRLSDLRDCHHYCYECSVC